MKRKLFSLLVLLVTAVTGAWAADTYTVAGNNSAMFGSAWDPTNTANDMTKNGDGTYSITYTNVYLEDDVQYKVVVNHSWNEAYPDVDRVFNIAEAGTYTLTIHFNPTTHEVYETMPGVAPTYDLKVGTNAQGSVKFYVGENEVTKAAEGATVTVVITPNTGWVVNQTSGQWIAAEAAARSAVPMLNGFELTKSTTAENTWSFTMERANAEISVTYKKLLTNQDITIDDITALTYTGVAQEPVVTVKDGSTVLTLGTDYTVAYSNNTNAALSTATENAPTVTITAVSTSEKYSGETTKKFTINKKALTVTADNKSVTFGDDAPTYTESYDGFVNNETKAVLGGTLALTCDYVKNQSGAGNYDITPSGLTSSNYDITFTKGTLTVGKKALEDGFIANIASLVYNGVAQEPAPVVTFNGMTLVKGTDYSVSYENNVNVGTATATVTALANSTKYSGSASQTFEIAKKALTVTADNKSVTFGDDAPTYTETYDGFVNNETKAVLGGTLALDCDYVKDQSGVGNYDITPSGYTSDNYDITFTKGTLTVGTKALENSFIADIDAVVYNAQAQEPAPVLTFHEMTLVVNTAYTVAYSNNTNAGTATVTCTGQGNYSGQAQKNFTIKPDTLTEVTLVDTLFMYDFKTPVEQTAVINEVKTKTLIVPATMYDIQGNKATEPDQYTVTVTGKTNFTGSVSTTFTIKEQEIEGDAEETESGEEVDDVKVVVGVVNRDDQTLTIREINEGSSSTGEGITVNIPAQVNGWNVVSVDPNALSGLNNVTDINMPDTEYAIMIGDNAFPSTATIHTTLALLDDYALMPSLKLNYESAKVMTTVAPANMYWTLGIGCDVIIPDGVTPYVVKVKNTAEVATEMIPEDLLKNGNSRIIKANNGVLLYSNAAQDYDLVAYSGRIPTGSPIATSDNKDYGITNCLEPVIEKKHYDSGHYFVLQNNEFHAILAEGTEVKVPAGRAVLHLGNDQAGARSKVLKIDSEATGIESVELRTENGEFATAAWYTLDGRKLNAKPTTKGMYILNGRKVVVK